jgi:tetratricopeptide (TPR) repeat protein
MNQAKNRFRVLLAVFALQIAFLAIPVYPFQGIDAAKLQIASSQHNIIAILLKEKNFDAVLPEYDKILSLRLPAQYDENVIKETLWISEAFWKGQRGDLSLRLLERGIQGMDQPKSKAALYQEMGYVYRLQGNDLKAMECFRRAQGLASKLVTRPEF